MKQRFARLSGVLLLMIALTACGSGWKSIPPPISEGRDVQLQEIWKALQNEMDLDPSQPAWVDWFDWDVGLNGEVLRVSLQVVATATGMQVPTTYQVSGEPKAWQWATAVVGPGRDAMRAEASTLFEILDRHGFPAAFIGDITQPATYYSVELELFRAQDVVEDSPLRQHGKWKVVDLDGIHEFTSAAAQRVEPAGVAALRVSAMVPLPPPRESSPGVKGFRSEETVYYVWPGVEITRLP